MLLLYHSCHIDHKKENQNESIVISHGRIKEIIIEELTKLKESSLDWEKNFKGFKIASITCF